MKTIFIPVSILSNIDAKKIGALNLPKNIAIAYSIQYQKLASEINKILSKTHNITSFVHVLGCSKPSFPKPTEAVLLISSGRFHAIPLAAESNLPIYIFESNKISKISSEDLEHFNKKKKASYLRYLNAERLGILISTKPGQENLKKAINFQKQSKKPCYLFISNNINIKEFENFSIDSWINTACPRLDFDSSVINMADL